MFEFLLRFFELEYDKKCDIKGLGIGYEYFIK